jgi:hypothetical protein
LLNKLKNEKKVLPPSLLSSLNFLQRLARKLALLKYISSIFLLSLGSCATLFILDRFIETPIWLRSFLTGSTFLIVLYFGYQLFLQAYILPRSQEWLARKIKKAFGGPGDRFLGIIELTNAGKEEEGQIFSSPFSCCSGKG